MVLKQGSGYKAEKEKCFLLHLLPEFLHDGILGRLALDKKESDSQMFVCWRLAVSV